MKKTIIFLMSLFAIFGLLLVYGQSSKSSESNLNGLEVKVKSTKLSYILGEPVILDFEIVNNTPSDIYLPGTNLGSRYLTVSIAFPDDKFKKYSAVGMVKKTSPVLLKKGGISRSSNKILWNANRAENASNPKLYQETGLLTYYAFPKPGVYFVKAVLGIPANQNPVTIESDPIQITIEEPSGEDLEVWNIIKDREDIGFFIQEAYVRASKSEEKQKTLRDIEQLIDQYPNSFYTESLRQSLLKFRANEEKWKEILEKRGKSN